MSFQPNNSTEVELKQLWGEKVPPLTPEQIDLSIQLWQKIKTRKQREQTLKPEKKGSEASVTAPKHKYL